MLSPVLRDIITGSNDPTEIKNNLDRLAELQVQWLGSLTPFSHAVQKSQTEVFGNVLKFALYELRVLDLSERIVYISNLYPDHPATKSILEAQTVKVSTRDCKCCEVM